MPRIIYTGETSSSTGKLITYLASDSVKAHERK